MKNSLNNSVLSIEQAPSTPAPMRDAFSDWLSDGNAKNFPPQICIDCIDKISDYVDSRKISCSLWEISKPSIFEPVYQKILDAKLLRIMARNTYKTFMVVGKLYIKFLKEKPWETITIDETASFLPTYAVQDVKDNVHISFTKDEDCDSINYDVQADRYKQLSNKNSPENTNWLEEKNGHGIQIKVDDIEKEEKSNIKSLNSLYTIEDAKSFIVDFNFNLNMSHTTPISISYFSDLKTNIRSWKELYVVIFAFLYEDYPHLFKPGMSFSKGGNLRLDLGNEDDIHTMVSPKLISNTNLYIETNLSATNVVDKIKYILDLCLIDYENIVITYQKKVQNADKFSESIGSQVETIKASILPENTTNEGGKVGIYIRNRLKQLAESGYVFSEQQLRDMCDLQWGKSTFRLATPHPFARIVDGSVPVSKLTKDEHGYNRYWNETFTFGKIDLLFTSQWYERNRNYLDKWLSTLNSDIESGPDDFNRETSDGRKYDPLKQWLIENDNEKIRISFSEITELVGSLPPSAYKHRAFWSNTDSHSFSAAWMGAGYKVVDCDLQSQYVCFARVSSVDSANSYTRSRRKMVKAALIEFSNNYKGEIKTNQEIRKELSAKYGHNEYSILPADYEISLNNNLPKLFRRVDHGAYMCLGYNSTQSDAMVLPRVSTGFHGFVSDVDQEKTISVITTRFKNGFRKSSSIDFERFKNFYSDEYNEEFEHDAGCLNNLLATEALVYDDRAYIYDEDIVKSVRLYLEQMDSSCIFIDTFFNKHSGEFYTFSIFSVEMLRAFIEKNYHGISIRWDYILLQDNVSPPDLIKEVFSERETWSFDELQERLPCLKMDTIRQTMNGPDYFRVDKGTYIHIDNMDLPDSEGEKIASFVGDKLRERDYVTANELDLSMFENLNSHCSFAAVRDAVFYKFLSDKYEKSGQVITKIGNKLRVLDIMEQYCREAETVSFEELNAFEATFDPGGRTHSQCLIAGHNTMIRVSAELFVSESNVDFDTVRIDEAIALYCHDDFIPLQGVTDFSLFPFAGYPWNLFLLESYVRRFSRVFKYDVRAVNSANIGSIVRKSFDYNDYDDILALALAKSSIKLSDKKDVGNYLFDKGYIGWRNLGKSESKIIKSAKALREGGAV